VDRATRGRRGEPPLPPGAVRLPPMPPTLTGAPLADPDGRRRVAPAADHTLTLMGADGVVAGGAIVASG
jgi:hypothetical protein